MSNSGQPICVTGASGFIGSHIVEQLLAGGHRVRGTVRDPSSEKATAHLRALPGAGDRLELVAADLVDPGAFDAAVTNCELVVHTASPYTLDAKDPQKDLVDPAVRGTVSALEACVAAKTVRRVVLTSSMAAITDEPDPSYVLTEADWNDKSKLNRNPYYLSKAEAERAAWRFMEEHRPSFDLVAINPFLVVGPSRSVALNPSNQLFADLLAGVYPGIMSLTWGMVDVRDVAKAHILAMTTPEAAGRYLCANDTVEMRELVGWLREDGYAEHPLPKRGLDCKAGDYAVRLGSYFQPKGVGSYLRTHLGSRPAFDNAKIRRELGLSFRPLRETVRDTVADLVRWGHVPAKSAAG